MLILPAETDSQVAVELRTTESKYYRLIVVPQNYHLMVLNNELWQLEPSSFKTIARRLLSPIKP